MRWRGLLLVAPLAALLLTGCGPNTVPSPPLRALTLPVDVATSRLAALPLLLGVRFGPFRLRPRETGAAQALQAVSDGSALAAVVSPLALLGAHGNVVVLERLASAPGDVLLAHAGGHPFRWGDLRSAVVFASPGAKGALTAAMTPYLSRLKPPPVVLTGGWPDFLSQPEAFLVAPGALAEKWVGRRRAVLADALDVEAGPWPAAVLVVDRKAPTRWPRLTAAMVLGLWQNAVDLQAMPATQAARRLHHAWPGLTVTELGRAFKRARRDGVLPDDPRVDPHGKSRLALVFPQEDWAPVLDSVDDRLADRALGRVF